MGVKMKKSFEKKLVKWLVLLVIALAEGSLETRRAEESGLAASGLETVRQGEVERQAEAVSVDERKFVGSKSNENNWGGRQINRACNFIPGSNGSYGLSTERIVSMYELPVETHTVYGGAGHVLETVRIPRPGGQPVMILYGLFMSSREMVLNCDRRAVGILLADLGFDVWLINYRSGRKCLLGPLFPCRERSWVFSFDDIALTDIPATIDYILKLTGQKKISWIGYSLGNSAMLAMLSLRPEYNARIHTGFMMSATVSFANVRHEFLQRIASLGPIYHMLVKWRHRGEVGLSRFLEVVVRRMLPFACTAEIERGGLGLCGLGVAALDGYDENQIDPKVIQAIMGGLINRIPSGMLAHYLQWVATGKFSRFDMGPLKNVLAYGQIQPPEYPIGRIVSPIVYFFAENDYFNTPKDVEISMVKLRSVEKLVKIPNKNFNHLGFAFGKDADLLVYREIGEYLRKSLALTE